MSRNVTIDTPRAILGVSISRYIRIVYDPSTGKTSGLHIYTSNPFSPSIPTGATSFRPIVLPFLSVSPLLSLSCVSPSLGHRGLGENTPPPHPPPHTENFSWGAPESREGRFWRSHGSANTANDTASSFTGVSHATTRRLVAWLWHEGTFRLRQLSAVQFITGIFIGRQQVHVCRFAHPPHLYARYHYWLTTRETSCARVSLFSPHICMHRYHNSKLATYNTHAAVLAITQDLLSSHI